MAHAWTRTPALLAVPLVIWTLVACKSDPMPSEIANRPTTTGGSVTETPEVLDNDPALVGTTWRLVSMDGVTPIEGTTITLELRARELVGSAGCNNYGGGPDSGAYSATRGRFDVPALAVTVVMCVEPAGIIEQEEQYLKLFKLTTGYQVTGTELSLVDENEQVRLVYQRVNP